MLGTGRVDKLGSKKGGQGNPEKDFSCDQCSYMGRSRKGLKNHVIKKHRDPEATEGDAAQPNEDKCPFCSFTSDPDVTEQRSSFLLRIHVFHEHEREFYNWTGDKV